MLTKKYIRLVSIFVVVILTPLVGFSQSFAGFVGIQSNSILDVSELRPSNPDQFLKHIFVRDSTYTYGTIPGLENEWVLESRATNTYDEQERLVGMVLSNFNGTSWVFSERYVNAYNFENRIGVQQKLIWSDSDLTWVNFERKSFDYNSMGLDSQIIVQYWDGAQWFPSQRIFKTYDLNGLIHTTIHDSWEDELTDWQSFKRTAYSYNESNLLEEVLIQFWVDSTSAWINGTRSTFEYNEDNRLIMSILATWSDQDDKFVDDSFQTVIYNDKGQIASTKQVSLLGPAEQDLFQESANYDDEGNLSQVLEIQWDEEGQEWENFKRHAHFWSKRYTGNLNSRPKDITCAFENPHVVGQPWFCESLKQDVAYTFEIYDLMGRLYYSSEFLGQDGFRIERAIPSGIYLAVIRGGLDTHSEKLVIR